MKIVWKAVLAMLLISFVGCGGMGSGGMGSGGMGTGNPSPDYSTKFPLNEDPISDGGKWVNGGTIGLDWTDIDSTTGRAFGLDEPARFADSTAVLQGLSWGPDQKTEAVVSATAAPLDQCYQEVELRLRTTITAHSITGYEINYKFSNASSAYLGIVRWNGPFGDFTNLQTYTGQQYGVMSGDTVSATIVGNVITVYKNGVQMGQATDDTFTSGSPGMGFNLSNYVSGCSGTGPNFGFSSFTALDSTEGSF